MRSAPLAPVGPARSARTAQGQIAATFDQCLDLFTKTARYCLELLTNQPLTRGCVMKRDIDQQLLDWKRDSARRALLVRGARQVGKTYSVRELGRTFAHYLEVNFEEHPDVRLFFRDSPDPIRL